MKNKGFTLTEMLVTISATSVVMAIMLPVMARSRMQGKTIMCLSNLRQMGIAAQAYANDNDDYYPIAYMFDPDPTDSLAIQICWDFIHIRDWKTNKKKIEPGLLWQGQTIDKIQQCPAFKGYANSDDPYTGYNYNTSFIGHGSGETVAVPAKVTQVRKPDVCALFSDGEYESGANKFMRSPFKSIYDSFTFRTAGTQGYRHGGATNVAWCDGHASSLKELYTDTDEPGGKKRLENYNRKAKVTIGFLSPDNSAYDLE